MQLHVYYDVVYHVLNELIAYNSGFQPLARLLRSPPIGVLELRVLQATGLPLTMKPTDDECKIVDERTTSPSMARSGFDHAPLLLFSSSHDTPLPPELPEPAKSIFHSSEPCQNLTISHRVPHHAHLLS